MKIKPNSYYKEYRKENSEYVFYIVTDDKNVYDFITIRRWDDNITRYNPKQFIISIDKYNSIKPQHDMIMLLEEICKEDIEDDLLIEVL